MPKATIDGIETIGSSRVEWRITAGVDPVMADFDLEETAFKSLIQNTTAETTHKLVIEREGRKPDVFEKLYIVRIRSAENPHIKRIVLADRRWFWKYKIVRKFYNMRRRSGSRRRGQWQEELQQQPVFKFQYAPFSMKNQEDEPWVAKDVLEDILIAEDALAIPEKEIIFDSETDELKELPIEQLDIFDEGHTSLAIALTKVPGADVTVMPDGAVRIFNILSGKAKNIVGEGVIGKPGTAGPEIVGGGHIEFDDRRFLRAQAVDVYFIPEAELRFDFLGDDPSDVGTITETDPPLYCENVMPSPDFELTLATGEKIYQGTYITIKQAIDAWIDKLPQGLITNFTFDLINQAFVPGTGYWASLQLLGKLNATGQDADWSARIAALQTHYRQTYRIPRVWMDKILSIRDYLVATIDVTSGQRAPAAAYTDHAFIPSKKALLQASLIGQDLYFGINVKGYPGRDTEITPETKPASARVQIMDSDQGIVRLNYQLDPWRMRDMILPSNIVNMPAKDFRRSNTDRPFGFDMASISDKVPQLSSEQRAAILLTAVPGAPNSKRNMYRIRITPGQVKSVLPDAMSEELDLAQGPVKEIRVGAGIETARVRWKSDSASVTKIKNLFGIRGTLADPRSALSDLVINDNPQAGLEDRAASLPSIAKAIAAAYYAKEHARVTGGMLTDMDSSIRLEGSMRELIHGLDKDGVAMTAINLPPEIDPIDMYTYMDPNTRRIVLKNVQPFD